MSETTAEKRPELLTLRELAAYLGVPASTVYYWRQRRTGPRGFRVGKALRYRTSDVEAWLRQQEEREGSP